MSQTFVTANPPTDPSAKRTDIQLLVLDIDGTIAGISNQIREPVKQAIAAVQKKGIHVAIATGRMYCSALRFHREIASPLPLICYQGAFIKDPATEQTLYHAPVSQQIALELLDYFDDPSVRSQLSVHCYIDDRLYVRELTPDTHAYGIRTGVPPIPCGDLRPHISKLAPTKVLALSQNTAAIDALLETCRRRYPPAQLYLTKSHSTFFEAGNPAVNKGAAVRYLAEEILGLSAANVMCVGDNLNDVEMLQYAGISVAMGNAPAEVQAVAKWVSPSVEQDGVAAAIEEFLL